MQDSTSAILRICKTQEFAILRRRSCKTQDLDFVSERTIKDIIIISAISCKTQEAQSHNHRARAREPNASHRLPTPRSAKKESASSAIFRATVQPCSRSVAPAAAASVLENGISTATRTHASTRFVRERRHPLHAAPKSSPARPPSSLAPSRPRPRPAGRARRARRQRLGPRLGDRAAPGVTISHHGAPLPPEQGRCAHHRARGRGAHRACPWAAVRAGAGRLQGGAAKWPRGTVRNLLQPLRAAQAPGARAHTPGTEHNSRGGRPRPAHAAEPPGPLHLHVLTALLSEPLIPSFCFLFFVLVLEARWLAQHVIAQLASSMLAYRGMADVRGVLLLFLVSLATGTIAGSTSTRTCFVQVPFYASREISLHAQWRQTLPES